MSAVNQHFELSLTNFNYYFRLAFVYDCVHTMLMPQGILDYFCTNTSAVISHFHDQVSLWAAIHPHKSEHGLSTCHQPCY